jgi:ABC-type sugar transport system permease subunit
MISPLTQSEMVLSPIHILSLFCVSAWIVFFSIHRLLMFGQFHKEELKLWENDFFVAMNICRNETLKANLGAQYQYICDEAEVNVNVHPILRAIRKVIMNTYLCGDTSCIHIFENILDILSATVVWTLLSVILTLFLVILLFLCLGRKGSHRRKTSYDIESTRVLMNDDYSRWDEQPKKQKTL